MASLMWMAVAPKFALAYRVHEEEELTELTLGFPNCERLFHVSVHAFLPCEEDHWFDRDAIPQTPFLSARARKGCLLIAFGSRESALICLVPPLFKGHCHICCS